MAKGSLVSEIKLFDLLDMFKKYEFISNHMNKHKNIISIKHIEQGNYVGEADIVF